MSRVVKEQTGPSGYVYVRTNEPCDEGDYCCDEFPVTNGIRRICSTLDPSVCNQNGKEGTISWYEDPSLTTAQRSVKVICDYDTPPGDIFVPKQLREPCISNEECAAGLTCSDGLCLSNLDNFCRNDDDCVNGRCLTDSSGNGVCVPFLLDTESEESALLKNFLLYLLF